MRPRFHPHLINDPFGDPGLYIALMFERRAILFDLGDVQALPARKLQRVSHVFVSHTHMDHFAGFDRLLRFSLGRDKVIRMFGPTGFVDRVEHKLAAYTWNLAGAFTFDLSFEAAEVGADGPGAAARFRARAAFRREAAAPPTRGDGILVEHDGFRVRAVLLDHGTPCLAFTLEETAHVNVLRDRLAEAGLSVGPWLRELKEAVLRGAPDETPIRAWWRDGAALHETRLPLGLLKATVLQIVPGQKIAYVVDAAYHADNAQRIVALAQGADTLFIETAFLDADADQAARRHHLTARQAGTLARLAGAKRLVPFHFSPRYSDRVEALRAEAEAAFAA